MTEEQWLNCIHPAPMLNYLRDRATDRKGSLFICAVCRQNWHLLYDPASQVCIDVVERFVDGQATEDELGSARWRAECPTFEHDFEPAVWRKWTKAGEIPLTVQRLVQMGVFSEEDLQQDEPPVDPAYKEKLLTAAKLAYRAGRAHPLGDSWLLRWISRMSGPITSLIRCIFGNPVNPSPLEPRWLQWNDATIPKIAASIYDERRFEDMPILADALQDAGCHDTDILDHCRSDGPHARGCWVLDLLLRKE